MKKIILGLAGTIVVFIIILVINLIIFEKRALIISEGTPINKNQNETPALLVIDIQESTTGEVSTSECYTKNSYEFIQKINQIIDFCDKNKIPVFYIKSEVSNWLINILNNSYAKGSKGAELDRRLLIISDYIIPKDKSDAFSNSSLDRFLIDNSVNKLYMVGLDAAHCVNNTIEAARNREYGISIISDAVISESDSLKIMMFDDFIERGVELISSEEFYKEKQPLY